MDRFLLIPIESMTVFRGSKVGRDIVDYGVPSERVLVQAHELGYPMHVFDQRSPLMLRTLVLATSHGLLQVLDVTLVAN